MPIKSYLVYPHAGKKDQLITDLADKPCDLIPATNNDVMVMISDTQTQQEEDLFVEAINKLNSLDHYTLVSGFRD